MFNCEPFDVEFDAGEELDVEFGEIQSGGGVPYPGEYEATPTNVEQAFETQGKTMIHDFIVHAIPNNYGLITWNGATLTVS